MIEVAAPTGGIGAVGAIAMHPSPLQHALDAAPHTCCGLGDAGPDRLKDAQHLAGVDGGDGQRADRWRDMGRERDFPLPRMLSIAPAGTMAGVVGVSALQ